MRARDPRAASAARTLLIALCLAALAAAAFAGSAAAAGGKVFVSPAGNDSWPGTLARPFATIGRAQERARELTGTASGNVVVNLRGGENRLASPLEFDQADSGLNGHRVIYQAYGYGTAVAEAVTISGGRPVEGWQPVEGGLWSADLGSLDSRQLYVDGQRASRTALGTGLPGNFSLTESGYVTDSTVPQAWANPADIELVYRGGFGKGTWPWAEARCGVAAISGDASQSTITMDEPCFRRARKLYSFSFGTGPAHLGDPTDVQNSPSFLTQPGSFYLDRSNPEHHVVYYLPRPGETIEGAAGVVPELETLLTAAGEEGAPLHDLAFRGLTFAYSTWLGPSEDTGFPHIISGLYELGDSAPGVPFSEQLGVVPNAVRFENAERVTVRDNTFTHLGAGALQLTGGIVDSTVGGNVLTDLSEGGMTLGIEGSNSGDRVVDNWVHDIGVEYPGGVGITVGLTSGALVSHNQVDHVPYSGMIIEGDLPAEEEGIPGVTSGQRVVGNRVFDTVQVLDDGGGIYLTGSQGDSYAGGATLVGNAVYGGPTQTDNAIGVYTDDTSEWVTLRGNAIFGYTHSTGGCVDPFIRNIRFLSNYWDDGGPHWLCENEPEGIVLKGNLQLPGDPEQSCLADAGCAAILANAGPRE